MRRNIIFVLLCLLAAIGLALVVGCSAAPGPAGPAGPQGVAGPAGPAGPAGAAGKSGVLPGTDLGMDVALSLSKPANGTHFVAGEKAVVSVTLKDKSGGNLTKDDFSILNLYAYGPQETSKTVSAVKLLNANTDRTKSPHHYVDLLKDTNVQVDGNTLKFTFQAVSDEEPGTYSASLWAVKKTGQPANQSFPVVDFQLGTATVEKQIVEKEKCGACHLGASNGQFYMHHVDPGFSPFGNPSIDSAPVRTCKSCHNNNGYAAYTPAGGKPTPDQIVFRVHGVHNGEDLKNPVNTDPKTGLFKDYTGVVFPADDKNCTACHTDDRWKTAPSALACAACHDTAWFGDAASVPAKMVAHKGGPQKDDSACKGCHPADGAATSVTETHKVKQLSNQVALTLSAPANGKFYAAGDKPVVTVVLKDDKGNPLADHTKVDNSNFSTTSFFVYGPRYHPKPVLTNAAKNGNDKMRASMTNAVAATGPITATRGWTFASGDSLKIAVNGNAPQTLFAPPGLQTPDQVRDWLKANLTDVTVTSNNTAGTVNIRSNLQGDKSRFEVYSSTVSTVMGWKPPGLPLASGGKTVGTTMEPFVVLGTGIFQNVDLRKLSDPLDYSDPSVTRNAANITYQLDDVKGLTPGTYMIYTYYLPVAGKTPDVSRVGWGLTTFQVGTEKEEPKVATNCKDCHGDNIWHLDEGPQHPTTFDTDYCGACHDYQRYGTGDSFSRTGGNSTSGWAGFGSVPAVRRVHQIHRGAYLDHPEEGYQGNPNAFNEIIFPQDIRNCQKCHDPKGSTAWKENPSRLACLACHDSDKAKTHAKLNTFDPTPLDPFGGDEVETCTLCHGAGKDFSPDKVHNVANPYVAPYPREPEHK